MSNGKTIKIIKSVYTDEGEGAKVRRLFPTSELEMIDPFVLMDEFYVSPPAGFPNHPHRGFEVVTYMLEGAFIHRDSMGNEAFLEAGGVQRITTGSGIVHSELPGREGMNHGIQLWVNLPKNLKGLSPSYQELKPDELSEERQGRIKTTLIVGEGSPVLLKTQVLYLDIKTEEAAVFSRRLPESFNAFIYVLNGKLQVGKVAVVEHEGVVFTPGSLVEAKSGSRCRFVLVAGKPHNEEVVFRGSFVD